MIKTTSEEGKQLSALLNAAVDAIIIIDNRGLIEEFNLAAENMFGYQAAEVIGKNVSMLMPQPYRNEHDSYISSYHQSKTAKIIGIGREVEACNKNGEVFPIYLSVGEVKESEKPQFVGIIRDISEQVKALEDVKETRDRLTHISRLSSMGELAAGIAHEINQPLTAVSTYAHACKLLIERQTHKDSNGANEKILETLEKIRTQSQRASDVIQRLREFVKKRVAQRERVSLNKVIQETVNMAKVDTRLLDHGIELQLHAPSPLLNVDPVQLQQVLLNLIRNAIDAMEDQLGAPVVINSGWVDEQNVKVSIIDCGHGISDEDAKVLFDPFFTTKTTGMGMGLPISQGIIHAHGGQLYFEPASPTGSIFNIVLPANQPDLDSQE